MRASVPGVSQKSGDLLFVIDLDFPVDCIPLKNAEIALLFEESGPIWEYVIEKRFSYFLGIHLAILTWTFIPYSTHIPDKSAISAILGGTQYGIHSI